MPLSNNRVCVSTYLTHDERGWLRLLADHFGLSTAATVKMLIHLEAERRGLKKSVLPTHKEHSPA
jgi:hypothetical protein